jgi:hypothetical protein
MTDRQAVGGLYIAAGGRHERRSQGTCLCGETTPAKALGANRIKLHGKDDYPIQRRFAMARDAVLPSST